MYIYTYIHVCTHHLHHRCHIYLYIPDICGHVHTFAYEKLSCQTPMEFGVNMPVKMYVGVGYENGVWKTASKQFLDGPEGF